MKLKEFSKYFGIFILGVLLIAVYKTFDNFGYILSYAQKIFSLIVPFFIAFGIVVLAYPPCVALEKQLKKCKLKYIKKNRRGIAVLIVYLMSLIIISLIFSFVVPGLIKSLYNFVRQIPSFVEDVIIFLNSVEFLEFDIEKMLDIQQIWESFDLNNINKYAIGIIDFSSAFLNFFMAIIISIYVLIDRSDMKNLAKKILRKISSEKTYTRISKYAKMLGEYLYKYLYCLMIDGIIIFVLTYTLMFFLDIKYALVLAIFIGVFNLIPYFGAIIAVVITCIITLFTASLYKVLVLAIALIVLQQIDSNIIQPKLVKDSFAIKPFWVILGVLLGGGLFGVLGIILAVPIMGLIKYIFNQYV